MLELDTPPDSTWDALAPDLEIAAAKGRAEFWNSSLKPHDAFEVYLVDQVAAQSVRIDRCQHQERAVRRLHAKRANLRWDEDRRNAAEALGARLAQNPPLFARKLDGTKQGCEWLIARWEGLGAALAANGDWDAAQSSLALDLLGVPAALRNGPTPLDGDSGARLALVRAEVDRLKSLNARAMAELDDCERELALQGFGPDLDGQLSAIRRFERLLLAAARMVPQPAPLVPQGPEARRNGFRPRLAPRRFMASPRAPSPQERGAMAHRDPRPRGRSQNPDRADRGARTRTRTRTGDGAHAHRRGAALPR